MKITALVLTALLLLSCVGCAPEPRDERLSIDYAISQLERTIADECTDRISFEQLFQSERVVRVWAKDAFLQALRLSEWEEIDVCPLAPATDDEVTFTRDYHLQRRYSLRLERTEESAILLEIGDRYGAIVRKDVKEVGYHSAVCFALPQSEEGELADAIAALIQQYKEDVADEPWREGVR